MAQWGNQPAKQKQPAPSYLGGGGHQALNPNPVAFGGKQKPRTGTNGPITQPYNPGPIDNYQPGPNPNIGPQRPGMGVSHLGGGNHNVLNPNPRVFGAGGPVAPAQDSPMWGSIGGGNHNALNPNPNFFGSGGLAAMGMQPQIMGSGPTGSAHAQISQMQNPQGRERALAGAIPGWGAASQMQNPSKPGAPAGSAYNPQSAILGGMGAFGGGGGSVGRGSSKGGPSPTAQMPRSGSVANSKGGPAPSGQMYGQRSSKGGPRMSSPAARSSGVPRGAYNHQASVNARG